MEYTACSDLVNNVSGGGSSQSRFPGAWIFLDENFAMFQKQTYNTHTLEIDLIDDSYSPKKKGVGTGKTGREV